MLEIKNILGHDTSTDFDFSVDGMSFTLSMTQYKSGIHSVNRTGEMVEETVFLTSDPTVDTKVNIYLVSDEQIIPEQESYLFSEWQLDKNNEPYLFQETRYRTVNRIYDEGIFEIVTYREGIDEVYMPENLIMHCAEFIVPAGLLKITETIPAVIVDGEILEEEKTINHGLDLCEGWILRVVS